MRQRILLIVSLFVCWLNSFAHAKASEPSICRSNETHIAWRRECGASDLSTPQGRVETTSSSVQQQRSSRQLSQDMCDNGCLFESIADAKLSAYHYLERHIMAFDQPFRSTLGFSDDDADLVDGLDGGLVGPSIEYALQAKQNYTWADDIPQAIYYEYVVNYANLNEARSNWRPLLYEKLQSLFHTSNNNDSLAITSLPQAVLTLNTHMWTLLAPRHVDSIVFVGGQTPLIFDTMSVLSFGYASCTGLAILFVNALRTFGIPARVVGTPAWHQERSGGNHNWVEVWYPGQWHFMEPSATRTDNPDSLDRNPCERWFCSRDRFNDSANTTRVFAARLESSASSNTFYRMAWDWDNPSVPGEDVTAYYQAACSQC